MDRVVGVFILVRHPYELCGGAPRGAAEGYIPGMKWIDASKIVSIEPLTPPPLQSPYPPKEVEHCCNVVFESGQGDTIAESSENLLALCNEAKKNAEAMRQEFINSHRKE